MSTTALATRLEIQRLLGISPRAGNFGPLTRAAFDQLAELAPDHAWPIPRATAVAAPTKPAIAKTNPSFAETLARLAAAEVGIHEIGGENRGPRIREYQRATWTEPGAWPWCAAFLCFLIRAALAKHPEFPFERPQTAGAWDFERWAREQSGHGVHLLKPIKVPVQRGDIVVFRKSHIGLATGPESNGQFSTVEGNTDATGGREGDGVYARRRKLSEIRSLIRFG